MMIEQSPFYILEVSTKDTKQTILDKAEEKALFEDPDVIEQAKEALLDSGKRLDAELGWFVYATREEEQTLQNLLHGRNDSSVPAEFRDDYDRVNYQLIVVVKRNYMRLPDDAFGKNVVDILRALERTFDEEETCSYLLDGINNNRERAGMPYVEGTEVLDHLYQRSMVIIDELREKINELEVDQVLASVRYITAEMTNHGEKRASELTESLLTMYEMETRQFADKQTERIHCSISLVKQAKGAPEGKREHVLAQALNEIVAGVKNWQRVMKPLQDLAQSQGREHEPSVNLLRDVRNAAIDMNNECEEPQFARQLTESLECLHAAKYLPEFQEVLKQDKKTLDGLIDQMQKAQKAAREKEQQQRDWAKKIFYKTELGSLFQDTFELSENGIRYDGHLTPLEDIVGLGWGAVRKYINGIPSGTDYEITYYDKSHPTTIKPDEKQFKAIVNRLWDIFLMIMISRICQAVASGKSLRIGEISFNDTGVVLNRTGIFHSGSKLFSWTESLRPYAENGEFVIVDASGKYRASASYMNDMNTHFFDALVHAVLKQHYRKLSDIMRK